MPPYLDLSGYVRCPLCRAHVHGMISRRGDRYFICGENNWRGWGHCPFFMWSQPHNGPQWRRPLNVYVHDLDLWLPAFADYGPAALVRPRAVLAVRDFAGIGRRLGIAPLPAPMIRRGSDRRLGGPRPRVNAARAAGKAARKRQRAERRQRDAAAAEERAKVTVIVDVDSQPVPREIFVIE